MKSVFRNKTSDGTDVITIVSPGDKPVDNCQQTDLFDLVQDIYEIAFTVPSPFYFDDYRRRCAIALPPPKWGAIARKMLSSGKFRRTGNYRRSPIPSRNGGLDWEYERI